MPNPNVFQLSKVVGCSEKGKKAKRVNDETIQEALVPHTNTQNLLKWSNPSQCLPTVQRGGDKNSFPHLKRMDDDDGGGLHSKKLVENASEKGKRKCMCVCMCVGDMLLTSTIHSTAWMIIGLM